MAGRPKHYSDEELIDRATKVFWEKGYTAASSKDLLKGMDIGQGSFYRSFPGGKKELYKKCLVRFSVISIQGFHNELAKSPCPIEFIKAFFFNIPKSSMEERKKGCYLGNSIVELSNLDEETKLLSATLLEKLQDGFEKALIKAKKEGSLGADKSPKTIALFLVNLWNGINVTQRMHTSKKQLLEMLELNLQILK